MKNSYLIKKLFSFCISFGGMTYLTLKTTLTVTKFPQKNLTLNVVFDIIESPQRVWDCSLFEESISFCDQQSDVVF